MQKEKKTRGNLIERKGKYYVVVSYYMDGHRCQDTKSTGILVSAHKKREAEKIRDMLVQEKEAELAQQAKEKTFHSFAECFERWLDEKSKQTENTTAWGYKNKGKTILEYFGERKIMIEELFTLQFKAQDSVRPLCTH